MRALAGSLGAARLLTDFLDAPNEFTLEGAVVNPRDPANPVLLVVRVAGRPFVALTIGEATRLAECCVSQEALPEKLQRKDGDGLALLGLHLERLIARATGKVH